MDSSCKNSIVTFISFCALPYCSGKSKICLSMPFGSSKLLFCDLVLQKFDKATNVSYSRWTTLKNTSADPCLWLSLWRLHSFHSRRLHDLTLKFFSNLWYKSRQNHSVLLFIDKPQVIESTGLSRKVILHFYEFTKSVTAILVHLNTLNISFQWPLAKNEMRMRWRRSWKKGYENEKFFTRNCIQVAINTEEKCRILTATKFIRTLNRYYPQWSLWGKRLFLLHFFVYLSVCNALWINLTHCNLYKLRKHVNKILYPQFFSHCSLSKKFCMPISFLFQCFLNIIYACFVICVCCPGFL